MITIRLRYILLLLISCSLVACSPYRRDPSAEQTTQTPNYPQSVDYYLAQGTPLNAIGRLIDEKQIPRARQLINSLNPASLAPESRYHYYLLQSQLALHKKQAKRAIRYLAQITNPDVLSLPFRRQYHELLASSYAKTKQKLNSVRQRLKLERLLHHPQAQADNHQQLWQTLQTLPVTTLHALQLEENNDELKAWLQLADISQRYNDQPQKLLQQIALWQQQYPQHPAQTLLDHEIKSPSQISHIKQVAVLLPLSGKLANPGKAVRDGLMAAHFNALKKQHANMKLTVYDTNKTNDIAQLYQQAIAAGADFVIGPLNKPAVATLAQLSHPVPTLALNYTKPPYHDKPLFYEFGISPLDEAELVANKASQDGYHQALIIAPEGEWGQRVVDTFRTRWQSLGGRLTDTLTYSAKQNLNQPIRKLLHVANSQRRKQNLQRLLGKGKKITFVPRRRQDSEMIFLLANPTRARHILPLLKYYYAGHLPVYATSLIYDVHRRNERDLNGVIFCDIPLLLKRSPKHALVKRRYGRLFALGQDAYQLIKQLPRMRSMPRIAFQATTGKLTLKPQHTIKRELMWARFKNGKPQPIS